MSQHVAAKNVWIDTDVSIGSPIREVDDAFALVLAFHSPELRIAGISTSYGNASLKSVDLVARDITRRFGPATNVYAGAKSPRDLGKQSAASEALATTLAQQRVTYIAIGPLTNLATALRLHPQIRDRIDQIIFVGGLSSFDDTRFGSWLRIHDANVFKDAAATDIVMRSGVPILLVPIATGGKLMIDRNDQQKLAAGPPAAEYLARKSRWWLSFWTRIVKANGGPVFDALAVVAATKPELLRAEPRYVHVDLDRSLIAARSPGHESKAVRYCTGFAPATKTFLLERLLARPR